MNWKVKIKYKLMIEENLSFDIFGEKLKVEAKFIHIIFYYIMNYINKKCIKIKINIAMWCPLVYG
jgi:hypothetical protein